VVLDYDTALKNCPIDTIRMFGQMDTVEFYMKDINGLIGAQLPDFVATTLEGKTIDKAYFENKVSVINFWFEGCHPCEAEMPGFNKLVERYQNKPVTFLAIGKNSPTDIKDFIVRKPFNFDHIAYGLPIIQDTFQAMWGYPLTFVADKDMRIVYASHGGADDTTAITKIQAALIPVIEDALAKN
jgi:thiol-disulfide isomerase/thioredoxin